MSGMLKNTENGNLNIDLRVLQERTLRGHKLMSLNPTSISKQESHESAYFAQSIQLLLPS